MFEQADTTSRSWRLIVLKGVPWVCDVLRNDSKHQSHPIGACSLLDFEVMYWPEQSLVLVDKGILATRKVTLSRDVILALLYKSVLVSQRVFHLSYLYWQHSAENLQSLADSISMARTVGYAVVQFEQVGQAG